ncbi:MAG: acyl-CoA dehydrogenase family protein, partial [Cyanobacteria bacterium P01_E01_bin.42]
MLTTYTVDRQVRDYLETAPNPEVMEEKTAVLREGLMGLGTRSLLALRVPREWKGQAIGQGDYFCFQETLAKHSGTLAFTQIQHQTAGSFIANGDNENLKSEYLPDMGGGRVLVGVGYSHLRRQGKPVLTAKPVSGGYHISGNIPWITGLNLFQEAVIAARLEDDRILFAILPLSPSADGKLHFSAPM